MIEDSSGKVRWKDLTTIVIMIFGISVSVCLGALTIHTGYINDKFSFLANKLDKLDRLELKLDALRNKVDEQNQQLLTKIEQKQDK